MNHGSAGWQIVFFSFALIVIAFEIVRGWRLGLVRQLVRLLALVAAYGSALLAGRTLLPVLRRFFHAPDLILSVVAGALLALLVYFIINTTGAVLFKRTTEQRPGLIRLLYGVSGGLLGIFFGLFSVWLVIVGIRSLGAIAGTENQAEKVRAPSGLNSLAQLKHSIEHGPLGNAIDAVDVVPAQTYETLGKLGTVVSDPRSAERFLNCPGARELTENPRIVALRNDPEIMKLIEEGRYLELLQNPKLIEALNDPTLATAVRRFDFQKALDYALKK